MTKTTFSKIVASAFIAAFSLTTGFAQTNLGSECGCPPVGTLANPNGRGTPILMSTLADANGVLINSEILTCDKNYTLDKKIYVPNGKSITIKPGVVVKGTSNSDPALASALIIQRGGKIYADGTQSCPIVFAAEADNLDGNFSMANVGQWGGIVVLGIAPNNLTSTNVYAGVVGVDGVGYIEGFSSAKPFYLYGAGDALFPTADPHDNSGILRYVSIRNSGALIANGNELNGLTLGSVGDGTIVEHIETIASADDNIELFGGTVNIKYCSVLFGNDDMFDWDLGWQGKGQFLFGMAADSVTGRNVSPVMCTSDNGFESDGDDDKFALGQMSHPVLYNVTLMGNNHIIPYADNTGPAAIQAKELTQGEIYNSIFINFRSGLHLAKGGRDAQGGDAYDNWTNDNTAFNQGGTGKAVKNSLKVKNNTFANFGTDPIKAFHITTGALVSGKNPALYKAATAASAADLAQFTADGNSVVASIPGVDPIWNWNNPNADKTVGHTSYQTNPFHATPTANIVSNTVSAAATIPLADGFFSVVNYRGAFDATKGSWLSDWAKGQVLTWKQSNPTDLNNDGVTSGPDFLIFGGAYGKQNAK